MSPAPTVTSTSELSTRELLALAALVNRKNLQQRFPGWKQGSPGRPRPERDPG